MTAAFINAAAANVHDFDDTHLRTVIHPTAPVAPPLLALAEQRLVTGPEFINALALGIEFTCRIGNAVSPDHYARGWHITATAVCSARRWVSENFSTWMPTDWCSRWQRLRAGFGLGRDVGVYGEKRWRRRCGARRLLAGLLAEKNYDGPAAPLEGVRGF